jgi:predicted ArsR family transcriptional regulator
MNKSMLKSAINRKDLKEKILEVLKNSNKPLSTDEIASKLKISWHTVMRHCLDLELQDKLSKFIIGRISAWTVKR